MVLKVWNGASWVEASGGSAINGVIYGPNGEIILSGTPTGATTGPGVGRYSRTAGPQEDAHLRSGAPADSRAYVEGRDYAVLGANYLFDGAADQRFDTSKAAEGFYLDAANRKAVFQSAPAGSNPLTWPAGTEIGHDSGNRTQIRALSWDLLLSAKEAVYIGSNCHFDGTNWLRYNTARGALLLLFDKESGYMTYYGVVAAANPITWTYAYAFHPMYWALMTNPPRVQARGGSHSPAHATWTTAPAFTSVDVNTGGALGGTPWNNTTREFSAPVDGTYHFTYSMYTGTETGGLQRIACLYHSTLAYMHEVSAPPPSSGNNRHLVSSGEYFMTAGQTVRPMNYQDSGTNIPVYNRIFSARYLGP